MVIVNQSRAHQRVLYEELMKNITMASAVSQQLLFPLVLSFSKTEIALLDTIKEQLENMGFVFSETKEKELQLTAIPAVTSEKEVVTVLEQLLHDLENEVPQSGFSQTDVLAKSMAKSIAVKTGMELGVEQQNYIVNSLFACTEPSVTPDNKTTFITLTVDEIDSKF